MLCLEPVTTFVAPSDQDEEVASNLITLESLLLPLRNRVIGGRSNAALHPAHHFTMINETPPLTTDGRRLATDQTRRDNGNRPGPRGLGGPRLLHSI